MTPSPLRSLWLVDALYRNGAVMLSLQTARRLAEDGAQIAVLSRLRAEKEVAVAEDVPLIALGRPGQRFLRLAVPATLRMTRRARRSDVVVNCNEIGMGLLVSFVAARLARRPVVVAVHADLDDAIEEWVPRRLRRLFYVLHRRVDGAICVSPDLVDPLVRNGLDPSRIRVVRNGIDIAAVRRAADGECLGADEGSVPVVVATGRVAHQKAYDVLVRAHAQIVGDVPHRVQIHNDGPDLEAIEALVSDLGVTNTVQFVEASHSPLPHVAAADVFCLPSRHEGLPLSLLEAVSLGVPCVASDCSEGVRTALDKGRIGHLVPVNDVSSLAEALRAHLIDPAPLRARAAEGPAHAQQFDIEVMTRAWADALGQLTRLAGRGGRARRRT